MSTLDAREKSTVIPQYDGDVDSDFSDDDDEDSTSSFLSLDGTFDNSRRSHVSSVRLGYNCVALNGKYESVQVVTNTQTSGEGRPPTNITSSSQTSSGSAASNQPINQSPSPTKRDRSASEDSSDGGDQPSKKKYQCHICNKLFPNSFRLKTHVRVHTGEKPYKCEPCKQAFADRSNFIKHRNTKTHKNKVSTLEDSGVSLDNIHQTDRRRPSRLTIDNRNHVDGLNSRGESLPQEVPQFEFLDSPLNQHDLDSHVPIDGYDTDDSIPMSFEDMQEVSLATEYFMFSTQVDGEHGELSSSEEVDKDMFSSQVDGEPGDLFLTQLDGEPDIVLSPPPLIPIMSNNRLQQQLGGANRVPEQNQHQFQQQQQTNNIIRNQLQSAVLKTEIPLNQMLPGEAGLSSLVGGQGRIIGQPQTLGQTRLVSTTSTASTVSQIRFVPGTNNSSPTIVPTSPVVDNSYSCELCPAKLKNKRNFDTHMKRHRGELPFKCDECIKTFQGRRDLETHKRSRHNEQAKRKMLDYSFMKSPVDDNVIYRSGTTLTTSSPILGRLSSQAPATQSTTTPATDTKPLVLTMNGLNTPQNGFSSDCMNTMLMKQDPVMVTANHKDEFQDHDDFILTDALFDNSLMDTDAGVSLSLDDLTSFAPPLGGSTLPGSPTNHLGGSTLPGSHDHSFDDGTTSFLSSTDMSHDTFDIMGDNTSDGYSRRTPSIKDFRSDSGITSPFTPRSGSGTPSLPDEGEFPCTQCDKRFGNRRNLMSHMRRHTGDYKLFCEDCGKGFFTQSKLDSHKRKHTGEKPFRCLYKPCLKRFRYKGDLSKHIKRYHPGHIQELTIVPLQEDEIAALENAQNAAKQKAILNGTITPLPVTSFSTDASTLRTVLTTGLRPTTMMMTSMQPPVSIGSSFAVASTSVTQSVSNLVRRKSQGVTYTTSMAAPQSDPTSSLDDNLLDMLSTSYSDDPMMITRNVLGGTAAGGSLVGSTRSSAIDTALVLPNTVFSSKPNQDQVGGGYQQLMSSGKSGTTTPQQQPNPPEKRQVFLQVVNGPNGEMTTIQAPKHPLPVQQIFQLPAGSTSSTTLRNLLTTSSQDSRIIRVPVNANNISLNGVSQSGISVSQVSMSNMSVASPISISASNMSSNSQGGLDRILVTGSPQWGSSASSGIQRQPSNNYINVSSGGNVTTTTQNLTPKQHTFRIQTSSGTQQINNTVLTSAQLNNMILGSNGQVGGVILTSNSQPSNVILTSVLPSGQTQIGGLNQRNLVLTTAGPGGTFKLAGASPSSVLTPGSFLQENATSPVTYSLQSSSCLPMSVGSAPDLSQLEDIKPTLLPSSGGSASLLRSSNSVFSDSGSSVLTSSGSLSESLLTADLSFGADSKDSLFSGSDTLSLEDLLSNNRGSENSPPAFIFNRSESSSVRSDRDSDLTSPGSVRSAVSELEAVQPRKIGEDFVSGAGEKLTCNYPNCSKTFDKANLLKRHLKAHTGEWRFVCDVCKKNFESNSKLEDHYRRHTGERPFQCHVCGSKFRYKGDRTKHLKNLHGVIKKQDQQQNGVNGTTSTAANISSNGTNNSSNNGTIICRSNSTSMSSGTFNNITTTFTTLANTTTNNMSVNSSSSAPTPTSFISNTNLLPRSALNMNNNNSNSSSSSISSTISNFSGSSNTINILNSGTEDRLISSLSSSDTASLMELDHNLAADPLDIGGGGGSSSPHRLLLGGCSSLPGQETVSMSLDDVLQYAQPVPDFSF